MSAHSAIVEFLQTQESKELPQDLREILDWHEKLEQLKVQCFNHSSTLSKWPIKNGRKIIYHYHPEFLRSLPPGTTCYHPGWKIWGVVKCPWNWVYFDMIQGTTTVFLWYQNLPPWFWSLWGESGSMCVCVQSFAARVSWPKETGCSDVCAKLAFK